MRRKKEGDVRKKSPILDKVEQFLSLIATLNLWDNSAESFKPENCKTFHDVTRFMHQVAIEEMFHLHEFKRSTDNRQEACHRSRRKPVHYRSGGRPFCPGKGQGGQARTDHLPPDESPLEGDHPSDACRRRVAEVDLKGFASVMLNTLSDAARYATPLGEKSYALISSEYVNFSSRLAYHFSTVDAYCSEIKNNNYVTFQFMGGGSSTERRSRRGAVYCRRP